MSNFLNKIRITLLIGAVGGIASFGAVENSNAQSRYSTPPDTALSADLASPWLLQLGKEPARAKTRSTTSQPVRIVRTPKKRKKLRASVSVTPKVTKKVTKRRGIKDRFLPQVVSYKSNQKAGTVVISSKDKYLYLILGNGKARRYGVGVGREGFTWSGVKKITRKAEWPSWTPPKEMIAREKKKGVILPNHMPGGLKNPLGARALYLGTSLYRIHGTTQPWTIGTNVSSGCIRMRNEDVIDFYNRVRIGTKVIVL